LLLDPLFQFCESYSDGRLEIDGNLPGFLRAANTAFRSSEPLVSRLRRLLHRLQFRRRDTLPASRENIHHHYDIGNEFYKLWLDEEMIYTCAYFAQPSMTLEQAQVAKMEHVCRKLQLKPGETVVDAGSGWGALALYMARRYGVTVRAYNISREQVDCARRRSKAEGLMHRVEFVEDDWRNIAGRCDAFVSVGMLEHVGLENYRRLGTVVRGCLGTAGRGLIHTIGLNSPRSFDAWTERRIFPGAQPPALSQMAEIFEPHDFAVLDVENLRLHYSETLKHWLQRFERSAGIVREMFDERFVRMWRLYLASSMTAFETGGLQLFQVVFAPGTNNTIPWTRHRSPSQ
jgi:cyclopropane-fatty-acyl-phospholipid synthase